MSEIELLPYRTINVFIERAFLEQVLNEVLTGLADLPTEFRVAFIQSFKQHVKILGFRNPIRAPRTLQINAYASAFEEKDEVVPFTLSAWTEINLPFAKKVKKWLESEDWKDLAFKRDYSEDGGFRADWPKKLTFEQLTKKFQKSFPDEKFSQNKLILMVLWITGRIPKEQSEL